MSFILCCRKARYKNFRVWGTPERKLLSHAMPFILPHSEVLEASADLVAQIFQIYSRISLVTLVEEAEEAQEKVQTIEGPI